MKEVSVTADLQGVWTEVTQVTPRCPRAAVVFRDAVGPGLSPNSLGSTFHRVLEWMGRVWGGHQMIAVPVVDGAIPDIFIRLATLYDPDLVLPWEVGWGEIELRDPIEGALLAGRAAEAYPAMEEVTSIAARRASDKVVDGTRESEEAFDDEVERLKRELSPFLPPRPYPTARHLQQDLPRPLTPHAKLVPSGLTGERENYWRPGALHPLAGLVSDLDLTAADPWLSTLLKIKYGVTGASQSAPEPRPFAETATYRTLDPTNFSTRMQVVNRVFRDFEIDWRLPTDGAGATEDPSGTSWAHSSFLASTPMRRASYALEELAYTKHLSRSVLIVAGDTVADAALYMTWIRIYGRGTAAWVPPETALGVGAREEDAAVEAIVEMIYDLPRVPDLHGWVTSFSLDARQLEAFREGMSRHGYDREYRHVIRNYRVVAPNDVQPDDVPEIFTVPAETFASTRPTTFRDGIGQTRIQSPVPKLMASESGPSTTPLRGNWVADAVVAGCRLPADARAAAAAEAGTYLADAGELRTSRTGTSWIAVNSASVSRGLNVEHVLNEFIPRAPNLPSILDAMVDPGWGWKPSSAGLYYQGFEALCGGFGALIDLLTHPLARPVLHSFVSQDDRGFEWSTGKLLGLKDMHDLLDSDGGREGDSSTTAHIATRRELLNVVDSLVERSILTQGLVFNCPRCRHTAFYPLGSVGSTFTCARCSADQVPVSRVWKPRVDPAVDAGPGWYYRLDGLVAQALKASIEGPVLALDRLGAGTASTRYSWAVVLNSRDDTAGVDFPDDVRPNPKSLGAEAEDQQKPRVIPGAEHDEDDEGKDKEVDFVILRDGQLIVGEAKTCDYLGGRPTRRAADEEIRKTAAAASLLSARQVVFATTQTSWRTVTTDAIELFRQHETRQVISLENLAN